MDYYLIAFIVFLLICLGLLIFNKQKKTNKVSLDAAAEKEKRLFKLYQNLEDMMNSIEEYVEETRAVIAKDKEEASDILNKIVVIHEQIKAEMYASLAAQEENKSKRPKEIKIKAVVKPEPKEKTEIPRNMSKNDLVRYLKLEGMEDESIARELGISRGEVALILGIRKK